jgi:hypothetical protein
MPSDFVKKNKMERGDFKTIIISSSIIFIWMDTKHIFLASNYHKGNEVVPILRRMKSGQRVTINCPQAIKDYNQFSRGVDRFNHRISCYSLDRKSKRNWLRIFIYFLNASISNSFICYNQLAQDKITYLNYMVPVAKSLCSGSERIRRGRPPSGRKPKLASPQTVLTFDNEMHLPVKTQEEGVPIVAQRKRKFDLTLNALLANWHFV